MFTFLVGRLITLIAKGAWEEVQSQAARQVNALQFTPAEFGALSLPAEQWAAEGWAAAFVEKYAAADHRLKVQVSSLRGVLGKRGFYSPDPDLPTCEEVGRAAREQAEVYMRVHFRTAAPAILPTTTTLQEESLGFSA